MSRYATTMYNRFKRVETKVKDLYSHTVHFKKHFDDWLSTWMEIGDSDDYQKLSAYYKGYIRGMRDVLRDRIWADHVVWMFDVEDGTGPHLYVHLASDQLEKVNKADVSTRYGHHYWKSDTTKRWA